jgi:hypothetical protein
LGHRVDLNTLADITSYLRERSEKRSLAGCSLEQTAENGEDSPGASSGGQPPQQEQTPNSTQAAAPPAGVSDGVAGGAASLWGRLFHRVKGALSGQSKNHELPAEPAYAEADTGPREGSGEQARKWWDGLSSFDRDPVARSQVTYRRRAAGSPAARGIDRAAGELPPVTAPTKPARLLRQLPVDKWVPEADE